jgi:hypothetical protein
MDPITSILTALVVGAAAGLKPTAEQAVKDAYAGIKSLIKRKYGQAKVDILESDPASKEVQNSVRQDLEKAEADKDPQLLAQAKAVLDAIQKYASEEAGAVGVSLEEIKGASLKIDDIIASGPGVQIKRAEIGGDIEIKGVRAGNRGGPPKKA